MKKFNIGDYVEASIDGWYSITVPGVLCKVVETDLYCDSDLMVVMVVEPGHREYGSTYQVESEYFKLVSVDFFDSKEMKSIMNFLKEDL